MVAVSKVFGFALLSLAVYFLRPLLPVRIYELGVALPLFAGGLYFLLFERSAKSLAWFRFSRTVVAIALLAAGAILAIPQKQDKELVFRPFSDRALSEAAAKKSPVLIDFYADWCLPCKELDHTTFKDPRVIQATRTWVLLKADLTRQNSAEVASLARKWQILGVPTLLFIGTDGQEKGDRIVGYVPPEVFLTRLKS